MRVARLQTNDLGRADIFFGSLLSKDDTKESDKITLADPLKPTEVNGAALPFRTDPKPRFSDPPAPPPQQPLPEKPEITRPHEPPSPSLKRSNTERPRSVPNGSPVRQEPTSQIITLVEALASAKKEIRDLEEMLQKERQARELAEEAAKRLELQSEPRTNGHAKVNSEGSVIEEAFEPPSEPIEPQEEEAPAPEADVIKADIVDPDLADNSTTLRDKRIEAMQVDVQELRDQVESLKHRAETAEAERDTNQKTLAEMVEKIRSEEEARRSLLTERARSPASHVAQNNLLDSKHELLKEPIGPLLEKVGLLNGSPVGASENSQLGHPAVGTLSKTGTRDPLVYQTTPYASMLGVVLLGMGIMAYLNGWQPPKVER